MLVNLTPHPLRFFPAGTPDHIDEGSVAPRLVLAPSAQHRPARLGQQTTGESVTVVDGITVDVITFGDTATSPQLPPPHDGTWYVVSLAVGLAANHRDDLLVLHEYVRDPNGRIVGARKLGRPGRPA
ncbi:hypothetical protein [Actinoplanes sp. G11-F43]|uniref:hypothetical protein n=1 Tax=Actinoplanes sp. G11-F43 TaxID=3424130 RepID=UPI003D33FAF2